jgi:hypothetical protein
MSSAKYQALPSDDHDEEGSIHHRHIPEHHQLSQDLRFNPPTPPWWKRALIILFILAMFWLYFSLRASMQRAAESEIVHAQRYVCISCCFFCLHFDWISVVWGADFFFSITFQRYSKQHKYRPAASPVIYENLKDGKTRVRGAAPSLRSL